MPYKYAKRKGWKNKKQRYRVTNWKEYNAALIQRGAIDVWICDDIKAKWHQPDRQYVGEGTPRLFSDFAIITCHEIRLLFNLSLRSCQGFISSIFRLQKSDLDAPHYSTLSKRLGGLNISRPGNCNNKTTSSPKVIAIDSSGLKQYDSGQWQQEKHKTKPKRCWRKLHIIVGIIQAAKLTGGTESDIAQTNDLLDQISITPKVITADGGYDSNKFYKDLLLRYPSADAVISPPYNAKEHKNNNSQRNNHINNIKNFGRRKWQQVTGYNKRNIVELSFLRYKKMLGERLHSRSILSQKNEAMIGCGVLNKMTRMGMPKSHRFF